MKNAFTYSLYIWKNISNNSSEQKKSIQFMFRHKIEKQSKIICTCHTESYRRHTHTSGVILPYTHEHAYVIHHKTFHVNCCCYFFILTFKQENHILRYILMLESKNEQNRDMKKNVCKRKVCELQTVKQKKKIQQYCFMCSSE